MIRKHRLIILLNLFMLTTSNSASAALFDRGNGMIYDSDLNITWLQDANYAGTSGYDSDGYMSWEESKTWAANLEYGGFSDWRLPTTTDLGNPGCDWGLDCFYNVDPASSEMAHMFFVDLGNLSKFDLNDNIRPGTEGVDWGLAHTGPFINLISGFYWSETRYLNSPRAWVFVTERGLQHHDFDPNSGLLAWGVRDGDVFNIPSPQALSLMMLGLLFVIVGNKPKRYPS